MAIGKIEINNEKEVQKELINQRTREAFSDCPLSVCPKCGLELPDLDGFGVLTHIEHQGEMDLNYPKACGYCSHPSIIDGVCGICEAVENSDEYNNRKKC